VLCLLAFLQPALGNFNRIASFPVCTQHEANCNIDLETVAEIVTATENGEMLIYGNAANESIGFVDISNPSSPAGAGILAMGGEVTSVSMTKNDHVLVGINTSPDFVNPSGLLKIVDVVSKTIVHTIDMGGQPDSVAVSPDKTFAVIAIENERDEDKGDGAPPQMPAGFVVIVDTSSNDPTAWTTSSLNLTGLTGISYNTDPEPEYVAINANNVAVVTLQENNGIVLIDLPSGSVIKSFSAGNVDLTHVDTEEEDQIKQNSALTAVPREPDGVAWLSTDHFVTADEGDLDGGSRGFTIFDTDGNVVYSSGNSLEHLTARLGHYPDGRSGNKGNEPENVAYGQFGSDKFLFVNSERSSLIFVYDVADPTSPVLLQSLPAAVGPEGSLAIPSRNLLVAACEKDDRGDKMRSSITIYKYDSSQTAQYPTLVSENRYDGTPIPWAALSGLGASPSLSNVLYSVEDSAYKSNRIFKIKTDAQPARIVQEIRIVDSNDVFAAVSPYGEFSAADLSAMINDDKTVNIDQEGIAVTSDGFWIASEGRGTVGDTDKPVESLNFLFKVDFDGVITEVVTLPDAVNDIQLRYGFEGVTVEGGYVVVAFQRAWDSESNPRLGIYHKDDGWKFVFYPLDTATSQNEGWVGLSDITSVGGGKFLVLERDNQGGPDASIKKIYEIELGDLGSITDGDTITKAEFRDLVPDLKTPGGLVYEKIEGMAVTTTGDVWVCNDNDGVDDNSGETQLLNLGQLVTVTENSLSCGAVRQAYKEQQCCGNPSKTFTLP